MKTLTKTNIFLVLISILSSSLIYAETHSITNTTDQTIRIEGRNTQVPEDLYFSELLEPGETKQYSGGSHRPYFAINIVDETGNIKAHSGELSTDADSHINVSKITTGYKDGDTYALGITKKNNQ